MELYENKLCATYDDLNLIVSYDNLKQMVFRGRVKKARRACLEMPALFYVDSLPYKYKTEIYRRNPDLNTQKESKQFVDKIIPDDAALDFFQKHLLDDGRHLTTDKQTEYANNAAILNAFRAVLDAANSQRKKLSKKGLNKTKFWQTAVQALPRLADSHPHSLPSSARRLQEKYNEYSRDGYIALITSKYGLRNAAKVDTLEKESLLIEFMGDARNLDCAQIAHYYNAVAEKLGWGTITPATVRVLREKHDLTISAGRLGESRFRNQKSMQVKRKRPELPLLYWTTDGWVAELLYQKTTERNGHNVTTYTNRLTVVVVLDPCLNYPVGYAIGERETPELIQAAFRNAANHTAELFGRRYKANQLQSDNYGRGKLTPLYQVMSDKYTPARAHNAKSKVIEPYFKYFNTKYCQPCKNWGGFGITSDKNLQPNSEFLNKNRHYFPTEEECLKQIAAFVENERAEKREQYVALFAELPEERKLPLSDEQYLLTFGSETGFKNALEGTGLRPTICGVKRDYDCFDVKFREYAHVKWLVKYDPENLDNVLAVNEDGSLRFLLERKYVQPMALADRKEGDAEQLARIQQYNNNLEVNIATQRALSHKHVEELFANNPQLDVSARLMLCDSRGQNKIHKETRRFQSRDIVDIDSVDATPVTVTAPVEKPKNVYSQY